jgi:hypothetical protein
MILLNLLYRTFLPFFILLLLNNCLNAQWSSNPSTNNPICTASFTQEYPAITSNGSGGAIITWQDLRSNSYYDIYAQLINSGGVIVWTSNGVAISTADDEQQYPAIISDGTGGAIITWQDRRNGTDWNIYAQRINSEGAVQWTANGVAICTAVEEQVNPKIVSDGTGGAIIVWADLRSGAAHDIYAQLINSAGLVQWTENGVAICTATSTQGYPSIISDFNNGAIISWHDFRGTSYDIYAQRINSSGSAQWTANGVIVSSAANDQLYPTMVSDNFNGAIITWKDNRNGNNDIYTQRINSSGAPQWTANGVAICTAADEQINPKIVSDGSDGAIITWTDNRSGSNNDIYARRINSGGVAQWTANGVEICTASDIQSQPDIINDGGSGAIITWSDFRSGTKSDIYAQKINSSGSVQWNTNGLLVCNAANDKVRPALISDGSDGAIITWQDSRNVSTSADIYASKVFSDGALPVELVSFTALTNGTNILLNWETATEVNNYGFNIETRLENLEWKTIGFVQGHGNSNSQKQYLFVYKNPPCGKNQFRLKQIDLDGSLTYSGIVDFYIEAPNQFIVYQNYPNPFNPTTTITYSLTKDSFVTLKIFNELGREVKTLVSENKLPGKYEVKFDGKNLSSGVYFYKITAGDFTDTKKLIILK